MATQFHPRDQIPPPPGTGERWWHYALAIVAAALLTFWALSLLAPHTGYVDMRNAKDSGAPTDDQDQAAKEQQAATEAQIREELSKNK